MTILCWWSLHNELTQRIAHLGCRGCMKLVCPSSLWIMVFCDLTISQPVCPIVPPGWLQLHSPSPFCVHKICRISATLRIKKKKLEKSMPSAPFDSKLNDQRNCSCCFLIKLEDDPAEKCFRPCFQRGFGEVKDLPRWYHEAWLESGLQPCCVCPLTPAFPTLFHTQCLHGTSFF